MAQAQRTVERKPEDLERRWLIVTGDGDHVTIGRDDDPTDEDLEQLARQLDDKALAGWLAVAVGDHYGCGAVDLAVVRRLSTRDGEWATAAGLGQKKRTLRSLGSAGRALARAGGRRRP